MLGKTADGRYLPTHLYLSPFEEKIKKEVSMSLFSQESFLQNIFLGNRETKWFADKVNCRSKKCPEQMN